MKEIFVKKIIKKTSDSESKSQKGQGSLEQVRRLYLASRGNREEIPFRKGKTTFWTSNDFFTIADIASKLDHQHKKNRLNIVVAESDIFSMLPILQGDIMICDIDRTLLRYIDETVVFLRKKLW